MKYEDSRTKQKKRAEIVEIGKDMFLDKGIAETTVMDIVKEAKIERKTFYNYFSGKQELADYIYYLAIHDFYEKDFGIDIYKDCKSGFEKLETHFRVVVNHYIKYFRNALYAFHYEFHCRKRDVEVLVQDILEELQFVYPDTFIDEAVEDGSLDVGDQDPHAAVWVVAQSLGAFASRLIFRSTKNKVNKKEIDFNGLKILLEFHLESLKKS